MDIHIGDLLVMKKSHPCGINAFEVNRIGMDFRIRCTGCGRELMAPRAKIEKNIKKVVRAGETLDRDALRPKKQGEQIEHV